MPVWIRGFLSKASVQLSEDYAVLTSGASHDAQIINHVVPAGIVFVPSRQGWTSSGDIALGSAVIATAIEQLDSYLLSQDG